jgi:hypothetical protein
VSAEAAPPPPQKVDALAALGPLVELAAKGGAGVIAVAALALQGYFGTTQTHARLEALDATMREEMGDLSDRIAALEERAAVAEALRERDQRADPPPAKR